MGLTKKFSDEVVILIPRVNSDDAGKRTVERTIEIRVGGNLGPLSVNSLLNRIVEELGDGSDIVHLARSEHHRSISSIRT